ncbi:hypothetical protein [Enterococcus casseliflavus]|uniref:hypothetical protein n=1 Tax=Enterococcus casseliflavus TaxID=37734 RepID=UPI00115F730B|nr:hypothetical protein [Enterococcus casseliflavus]
MCKLVYGKKGQVVFDNENEKNEAINYLLSRSDNITFVKENNQNQGAWGPEYRIHFKSADGVPPSLIKNMSSGRSGIYGRINCAELIEELKSYGLSFE